MTKATATIAILLGLTLGTAYLVAKKRKNTKRGAMMALLALLAFGPTAWAQNSWDEVYAMTQTTSADWTALAGSTTGQTLGSAGNTTYYYANSNLSFTNSNVGGSGLKIQGTVYLYVPEGVTLTCTGANANGQTGAGAGIELASGNTLYLLGGGTVNATGGNAANGGSGGTGGDATGYNGDWTQTGAGGTGGTGGGGAGAGIGTRGGAGGSGGSGGAGYLYDDGEQDDAQNGTDGSAGSAGSTAGAMGNLYWLQSFAHMTATGGSQGTSGGSGGQRGRGYAYDGYSYNVSVAGGGGGGGGGFGGAASNIGTGGPGGGGGGGGAGGAQDWKPNSTGGFYDVTAYGGKGGQNANGEYAADGTEAATNETANNQGWVTVENGSANSWHSASGSCTFGNGGSGGACGNTSTSITIVTSEMTTMTSGIYTVLTDVTISNRITINGNVVLNLGEGATLHAPKGIDVSSGNSLIINGPGTLTIDGCDSDKAGIGAQNVGTLTINGGIINVRGGANGAGIGGNAWNEGGGTITINGGIVNANGGYGAAGIGGGISGGNTYNNGQGTGMCGNVYIYGGQVTAVGGSKAAGIGPGVCTDFFCLHKPISGNLTIGWTNPEDFLYSSGFYSQNGSYYNETLSGISFVEGKQFIIEGLGEIADPSLPTNFGSRKILPLVDQATALPGTGSLGDPYRISNLSDWMKLAVNVNSGTENYSGKYVRLENDLSVSIMVGNSEGNSFRGTFLGNNKTLTFSYNTWEENAAPFRFTNNATIKDLKVAGSISTSAKFAAGLASRTFGTTSITNCQVDTYIQSNINGDGTHGGIVAMPSGTLNIEGCAFTGRLLTNKGTHSCGGFVGWHNSSTISVINSLYAPSSSIPSGWSAITGGATFVRGGSPTINNCYYTEKLGDVQGSLVLVYPSDPGNLGNVVQAYSTLTAYTNGIFCDDIYYLKAATFSGAGNEGSPYLISNEFEWRSFAAYVNSGFNTYSGKYMKLTADISVTEMVGSSEGNSFQGTFLGNGNTITANIISTTTGEGANEQGVAPFHYINNATIKDLTVAGSIASASYHTSGIVGFANGTNTIEGCVVTATLNISNNYAGGIIGHGLSSNTTIRGCVFAGTINGVDGNRENIGGIWGWSTSGTPTLLDCLENGTYTNIASMHPMGLQGGSGTITNCYYLNPQDGNPTNACTVSGAVQALTDEEIQPLGEPVATYSTSGINVYANGISYGGNFYYHPDKNIKLTVQGYGNSTENDHWAFIASPVAESIDATTVGNIFSATEYDLYRFNPSADLEWENWKQEGNHHHFNLENGRGYLYATKETKTLGFSGTFNMNDTKTIENLPQGFNLVGNPFIVDAYINKPYYTLNGGGSAIVAQSNETTTPIAPCHGVIVEVNGNESVTFSKTAPAATANQGMLNITVAEQKADTRGASTGSATAIDNAIVRFGEGEQLGKFHFGNPSANISIPQGGKEYAVANVNVGTDVARNVSTNEIPVNFKASKNGEYTISFNPENVEFDYLHLIDNLTGSDVDLLALRQAQGPASYTFTAKTTDYASRFRLVFSASGDACEPSGNFAFISNGNIIVNGEGTLQVVEVTGRVIVCRDASHASAISTSGMAPGVYVLRLINGNDVKTQKIVIE